MAILDTFYTLFKTNSDEYKTGVKQNEVANLTFASSVRNVDEVVTHAGKHIIEVFDNVAIRIASVFAIEQVLEFTARLVETNAALQDTSERIGVAVEDLAALQSAAKRFGGSADGVTSSLDFLNKGMADIAVKGTSRLKPFFDELKISPVDAAGKVRPLLQVYGDLADKFQKMSAQERAGYGEKFGIDQGLLLALASGRRGFEDLIARQKELGVTTKEDAELADQFEKKMDDLRVVFAHTATTIASSLLPMLSKIVDGVMAFSTFVEKHKPLIEGFFIGLGGVIATFYTKELIKAVMWTLAFAAEWLLIPALILAVAAAFAFAFDDVKNFLEGNKSVIGELSKKWPIIGEVVRDTVKTIGDALKSGADLIGSIFNVIGAFANRLGKALGGVWKDFKAEFPEVLTVIKAIGGAFEWLGGIIKGALGWFFDSFKDIPKAFEKWSVDLNGVAAGQNQLAFASAVPLSAASGGGSVSNKSVSVKTGDIHVHTQATDPKAVAGAVGDTLADHIQKAIAQHDDGVAK